MAATLSDADARPSAARYRLVVAGQLGPHHASAFDEITVRAHDGETDITRPIIDQSHFQAELKPIASLELTAQPHPTRHRETPRLARKPIPNQPGQRRQPRYDIEGTVKR